MIGVSIKISDTLSPAMKAAGEQARPARLAKIAARLAEPVFVSHFERLSQERHRPGMPHDFYLQAARAVHSQASGPAAFIVVRAPTGLRQRLLGGWIAAVKPRTLRRGSRVEQYLALWIPVGRAVGRTGGDYRGALAVIWNRTTRRGVAVDRKTKEVLFALVDAVHQDPDSSVMPDMDDLRVTVLRGVADKIERAWQRRQASEE